MYNFNEMNKINIICTQCNPYLSFYPPALMYSCLPLVLSFCLSVTSLSETMSVYS